MSRVGYSMTGLGMSITGTSIALVTGGGVTLVTGGGIVLMTLCGILIGLISIH